MHVFDQLTLLDSLILVLGMYVSCAVVGSIVFSKLGTPWEFSREWFYMIAKELVMVIFGYAASMIYLQLSLAML